MTILFMSMVLFDTHAQIRFFNAFWRLLEYCHTIRNCDLMCSLNAKIDQSDQRSPYRAIVKNS